jgi:hypothetical protein
MLNAVWLRQESVAAAIPGNLGSRRLPLLWDPHPWSTPEAERRIDRPFPK